MNVRIVIPALNEEKSIGKVIEGFKRLGYDNILVVDGHSTDRTREVAKEKGADVIIQSGKGKGQAIMEAFKFIDEDVAVLIDADASYLPEEVEKLLEPIRRGIADHVVGNRFANFEKGAFTKLNLIGNKILNLIFRLLYGISLHDILSGYRALTKEVYKEVDLEKTGFEVETELTVETISKGFKILEVPITYKKREGKTKLRPIRDGYKIFSTIYSLLSRYSPSRYFYLFGTFSLLLGLIGGIYVIYEWFKNVSHYLLVTLVSMLIISGLLLLAVGLLSDSLFRVNMELRRELREIKRKFDRYEFEGKRD